MAAGCTSAKDSDTTISLVNSDAQVIVAIGYVACLRGCNACQATWRPPGISIQPELQAFCNRLLYGLKGSAHNLSAWYFRDHFLESEGLLRATGLCALVDAHSLNQCPYGSHGYSCESTV